MKNNLFKGLKKLGRMAGPGVITGAADDDPSGILTYLQAGFSYGFKILWLAFLTLPFMIAIQEMSGRIGYVSGKGLVRLIKNHYAKWFLYLVVAASVVVIIINIGADLLAMGVVMEGLLPMSKIFWIPFVAAMILIFTIFLSYPKFASVLKWLSLSLLFYVAASIYTRINFWEAAKATLTPTIVFNKNFLYIAAAFFGTTVSPYLFFWQANEEIEEREKIKRDGNFKKFFATKGKLKSLKHDTFIGMIFSNIITWFIVVAAANLVAVEGYKNIADFKAAASVLRPLLGRWAFLAFGVGIIGTGLLVVPVLAGAVGYMLAEVFNWSEGMNKTFKEAKSFYGAIILATLIGVLMAVLNLNPVGMLIYTAVLYSLITPPITYAIVRMANNKKIVGNKTSSGLINFLGWATFAFSILVAGLYILTLFHF
ncbi:divalent metal cation transporter [Patescibacteria group bacterium]|nr:divalent metal cation transporter [Patescibacteria group bacterium]MCL5733693.1 divalent metal cation transporter [Patescibacteria group bacterium]